MERVVYTYYGNENYGTSGDLKTAKREIKVGSTWVDQGTHYYRYYKQGEANGFVSGLKYELSPDDYANLVAAYPSSSSCNDTVVAGFASKYFEYDSGRRVVLERVRGGQETYLLSYTDYANANRNDANAVHHKTIETRPNGSQRKVYTNYTGSIILSEDFTPIGSGDQSIIHYPVRRTFWYAFWLTFCGGRWAAW